MSFVLECSYLRYHRGPSRKPPWVSFLVSFTNDSSLTYSRWLEGRQGSNRVIRLRTPFPSLELTDIWMGNRSYPTVPILIVCLLPSRCRGFLSVLRFYREIFTFFTIVLFIVVSINRQWDKVDQHRRLPRHIRKKQIIDFSNTIVYFEIIPSRVCWMVDLHGRKLR